MNNDNDPFADLDGQQTQIVKPKPGARPGSMPSPQPAAPQVAAAFDGLPPRRALNPLENAASRLLNLMVALKTTHSHPNVAGLHRQLLTEVQVFEREARAHGVTDPLVIKRASYVLCAALDDVALNLPWGQEFGWSRRTLQGTFFHKEWAGDEFFKLLDKLIQDPPRHRDLLELMYVCLALGFKGGYRVYDRHDELEERRERLYRALRNLGDDYEPTLSPHWRGVRDRQNAVIRYVPLWVLATGCALLLLLIYLFFYWRLNAVSDPLFAGLAESGRGLPIAAAAALQLPAGDDDRAGDRPEIIAPPPPPPPPTAIHNALREALAVEPCLQTGDAKWQGQEQVIGTFIRTSPACGLLFDSGKWDIKPEAVHILNRLVAPLRAALDQAPGWLVVTGHTDNVPIRYITNHELSQRRAEAALAIIRGQLGPLTKISVQGRADAEPVAPNDTAEGRARNRRVEVLLLFPSESL